MIQYTLDQLKAMHSEQLSLLIAYAGTQAHLARMLDISPDTVKAWKAAGRISKAGAVLVENHETLGKEFTAVRLRPEMAADQ